MSSCALQSSRRSPAWSLESRRPDRRWLSPADQSGAYQVDAAHDGSIADAGLAAPLTQAWSITLPAAASYPLIVNGTVFVIANSTLYALNQATRSTIWSHGIVGGPGLTYDQGRVFVLSSGGLLTAFDPATGSIDWSKQLPNQWSFTSAPTALNGIVYTGGAGSGGTVYATRESDRKLLWTQAVENGDDSSPAVDAQGVYVTYACQQDYAFDPLAGTLLWHHSTGCEGGGGATPVVANGLVFSPGFAAGNLILSAADGSEIGPFNADKPPAVANDMAFMLSGTTLTAVKDSGQRVNAWTFSFGNLDTAPLVAGGLVFIGSSSGILPTSGNLSLRWPHHPSGRTWPALSARLDENDEDRSEPEDHSDHGEDQARARIEPRVVAASDRRFAYPGIRRSASRCVPVAYQSTPLAGRF